MIDRYGTWGQAMSLRQMMDRLLQDAVVRPSAGGTDQWVGPALNAFEDGDTLVIEAHLPGFTPDDIDVHVQRGILTIAATRQSEEEKKERHYLVRERRTGRFVRSLQLPTHYHGDPTEATYQDGVLRLIFPKSEAAKPHRVKIGQGDQKAMASGSAEADQASADGKAEKEPALAR
jgi:HSP20 family protein